MATEVTGYNPSLELMWRGVAVIPCWVQMTLVFDTETSGLLKDQKARPIQLGWVVLDRGGVELDAHEVLLKTVSEVPIAATNIHRISTEKLMVDGVQPRPALELFLCAANEVLGNGGCIVAHNAAFDVEMLRRACVDCQLEYTLDAKDVLCTMKRSTALCKCEPFRYGTYKWPKLIELADRLGIEYDASLLHGALADTRLTAKAYLAGKAQNWW